MTAVHALPVTPARHPQWCTPGPDCLDPHEDRGPWHTGHLSQFYSEQDARRVELTLHHPEDADPRDGRDCGKTFVQITITDIEGDGSSSELHLGARDAKYLETLLTRYRRKMKGPWLHAEDTEGGVR